MIPHLQLRDNLILLLCIACFLSLLWKVGVTSIIFFVYAGLGRSAGASPVKRKFLHVSAIALSYVLLMGLAAASLFWDLYHYEISCWCFPLAIRIAITIPGMILGDWALWQMGRYQYHLLFAEHKS